MPHPIHSRFTRLLLEVEVSSSALPDFVAKYMKITGSDPRTSDYCQRQENKWGLEARLYFDGDDTLLHNIGVYGYHIEERSSGYRSNDFPYRVNSQELFWAAVRHGYRLGENAPIP
jgi:hypothetical protein